ncbi:hypothetical protein [Cecembia rubra]|uniref:hypothetical protein n=1 Tax=Cecembia rubra TaxID=1485585 RepID=UPI002714B692|nr:hypothetical protein [Cecembia rubra]
MKINKIGFGFLMSLMMVFTACVDFVDPNIPYKTFDTALYLRTLERSTDLNFFSLGNARVRLVLEAVDAEGGETLQSVEIRVRHRRLITGVGFQYIPTGTSNTVQDVLVKTLTKADFQKATENPNHPTQTYLRTTVEVTATEMIAALGLTPAQIEGGDAFEVRLRATDRFGRVFTDTNRSADVAGGFFYASPFFYAASVVCPSDLVGTYRFRHDGATGPLGSCPPSFEGTTTWTRVSPTSYRVSDGTFGYWACIGDTWGTGNVVVADACGRLTMSGADKYGDLYSMEVISSSTTELVFRWVNTYGESGTVTMFANEGKPFPAGLR